jgi:hypothetical protein
MENPGPLKDYTPPVRGLKRNSISMPALSGDDLERLQALYRSAEGSSDSEDEEDDDHHSLNEDHSHKHRGVSVRQTRIYLITCMFISFQITL